MSKRLSKLDDRATVPVAGIRLAEIAIHHPKSLTDIPQSELKQGLDILHRRALTDSIPLDRITNAIDSLVPIMGDDDELF
jgi:hypothetical protein